MESQFEPLPAILEEFQSIIHKNADAKIQKIYMDAAFVLETHDVPKEVVEEECEEAVEKVHQEVRDALTKLLDWYEETQVRYTVHV